MRDDRQFVNALKSPLQNAVMVKAGAPVDAVINQLVPLLKPATSSLMAQFARNRYAAARKRARRKADSLFWSGRFRRGRGSAQGTVDHARRESRRMGVHCADLY
jgi:6-phosphogluconate dehydrogenase